MCPPKYVDTVKPRFMDTLLIRTAQYDGQFAGFVPEEIKPYIFSKFNPLITDTL